MSPGPFTVERTYSNLAHHDVFVVLDGNGTAVCDCDSEADAVIHADAPAMLELLREFVESTEGDTGLATLWNDARALLDKHGRKP